MTSYISLNGWKSNIRFSSAHVIHEYEKCGRLHGHTYAVHVKIYGKIDKHGIILDFSYLKDILRRIVDQLDHRVLIPENNNLLSINKNENNIEIIYNEKKYVFPIIDCVFLPCYSTSAENLALYIIKKLIDELSNYKNLERIEIGVDEGYGQGARIEKKINI